MSELPSNPFPGGRLIWALWKDHEHLDLARQVLNRVFPEFRKEAAGRRFPKLTLRCPRKHPMIYMLVRVNPGNELFVDLSRDDRERVQNARAGLYQQVPDGEPSRLSIQCSRCSFEYAGSHGDLLVRCAEVLRLDNKTRDVDAAP